MNNLIVELLGTLIPLTTAIVGLIIWLIRLWKRNRKVCEIANVMGENIDNSIIECKNDIAMWEEIKSDGTYRYYLEPDVRETLLTKLKNKLEHLQELSERYHKQDIDKIK